MIPGAAKRSHAASEVRSRRRQSASLPLLLPLLLLASALAEAAPPSDEPSPRKAFVPANAPAEWPAGNWNPVPISVLTEFLRDAATGAERVRPTAYIEQAHFRGALTEDFALAGTWSALVRCPDGSRPLIELGPVSPVLSELEWAGVPAVWGTDPYGRTLLYADQPSGTLSGRWSLAGQPIFDRVEFQVRIPPGASSQCEIAIPAGWQLRSSAGLVRAPRPAERDGWLLWTIELGQHGESLWTLQKSDTAAAPVLLCDRTIVYSIRPDGNRIQAEFAIQAFDDPVTEIAFLLPAELTNPTVTYSTATNLAARMVPHGNLQRLVVPLPSSEPGRLGTFRVAADLPPTRDGDAPLPVVSLDGGVILRGNRRVDVDRPLTLKSLDIDGLRQSAVISDELGTDWIFEELRPDGRIVVHVGRPQTSLTAHVATHITWTGNGRQFHAVVSLQARTGSTFRTTFELPPACDIVDVYPSAGIDNSGLSHWSMSRSEDTSTLTVEFRQALHGQSPKLFEISGWWMDPPGSTLHIPAFPIPREADDWQVLLAVSPGPGGTVATGDVSPLPIGGAQIPSDWATHLQLLKLAAADPGLTWFAADGASPPGEIVIDPMGASAAAQLTAPGAGHGPQQPPAAAPPAMSERPALALALHSLISSAATAAQWHDARYTLSGAVDTTEMTFVLPEPAVLDAAFVDGRGHATEVLDDVVKLAPLPPDAHELLVRYRTPPAAGSTWLRNRYQVPLPRWTVPVAGLRWSIALPQGHSIGGYPPDLLAGPFGAERSRLQRLFSPWLRPVGTSTFNPLSKAAWRNLLGTSGAAPGQGSDPGAEVTFVALDPPSELALETWDEQTADRLAQLALITCLACAVAIRRVTARQSRTAVGIAAAIALLVALFVPDGYVPLAGGCLLGFAAGALLPSRWVQQRDLLAAWHLRRRSVLASAAGYVALLTGPYLWYSSLRAQEPDSGGASPAGHAALSSGTRPEPGEFDMLIPYQDEAIAPVGYLDTRVLPKFTGWLRREHVLPPYLFRSVEYELSDADPALIRAVLDVVLLSDARRAAVVLPFREIAFRSPDDCEIDGRRTQVRPEAAGNGFVVEVEPAWRAAESAAAPTAALVPRHVEIAVWFRMIGSDGVGGCRCRVPPINDARLHLPAAAIDRGLRLTSAQGAWRRDGQGNLECDLGGAGWITVDPLPAKSVTDALHSPLRADATTLVEVHPMRLQARTRVEVSPRSEESGLPLPRRLNLLLPGRAEVRQVSSDSLREFSVWHSGSAVTVLEIDLDQPLAPRQKIEFEYTVPFNPRVAAEVPAMSLLEGDRLLSHRIGLRAAPGMTLQPDRSAVVPGRLQELLPDWLPPDTTWPPPDAAFAVLAPTPIPIRLTLLEPARSVAIERAVTIESRALRLEALAHMEVSGTQVFEHELRIPPELRIDALSVDQDGANRLLDWSRDGDRLVIHLREGRAGRQLLRLRGWLPLQSGEITRFPSLSFRNITPRSSELILRNISGQSVELIAEGGSPVLPGFSAPTAAAEVAIRRFAGPGPMAPVGCRVVPAANEPHLESIAFVEQRGQNWTLTVTCRIEDQTAAPLPALTLNVPRQLARQFEVAPADMVHSSQVKADGSLELQLQLPGTGTAGHTIQMTAPLAPPTGSRWSLPLPDFAQVPARLRLLVLPPAIRFVPDEATAVPFDPSELLADHQEWLTSSIAGNQSYRITAEQVTLAASETTTADAAPALLETVVWEKGDRSALGLTVVYLSAANRQIELALTLPHAAQIVHTLDGDHLVETHMGDDRALTCTIQGNSAGGLRRVAFLWRRGAEGSGHVVTTSDSLPVLKGLSVDRQFVTVVPPRGRQYFLRGTSGTERPEVYRLGRSERLLHMIGGHSDPGHGPSSAHVLELARSLDAEIARLSSADWRENEFAHRYAALRARWDSIRGADWLTSAVISPTDSAYQEVVNYQIELVSRAVSNQDAVALQPAPGEYRLEFWSVGEQVVTAVCGLLFALVLLVLFIAWHIVRRRWRVAPIGPHVDYLGLVLLGLFWWFALRFGALGLMLAVSALALQAAAWLRKGPEPSAQAP